MVKYKRIISLMISGSLLCFLSRIKAKRAYHERGMLFFEMVKILKERKPRFFIAENVKGLVSFGDVKSIIENDFRNIDDGYLVVPARVLFAVFFIITSVR